MPKGVYERKKKADPAGRNDEHLAYVYKQALHIAKMKEHLLNAVASAMEFREIYPFRKQVMEEIITDIRSAFDSADAINYFYEVTDNVQRSTIKRGAGKKRAKKQASKGD